jgi:hypothetical protein
MSSVALHLCSQPGWIRRAEAWLEGRPAAEELLIVGATLDAANQLAREVAKGKRAAFEAPKLRARCTATLQPRWAWCGGPCVEPSEAASPIRRLGLERLVEPVWKRFQEAARLTTIP